MKTNPDLVKDGLVIRVDFFKTSGKWYAGGEVNIGNARMWQGDDAFQRAIIENQKIMNGCNWIGRYHVVTSDLSNLWAREDYHEFNLALMPIGHWSSLRDEYVGEDEDE